jgi:hypothetical protein
LNSTDNQEPRGRESRKCGEMSSSSSSSLAWHSPQFRHCILSCYYRVFWDSISSQKEKKDGIGFSEAHQSCTDDDDNK